MTKAPIGSPRRQLHRRLCKCLCKKPPILRSVDYIDRTPIYVDFNPIQIGVYAFKTSRGLESIDSIDHRPSVFRLFSQLNATPTDYYWINYEDQLANLLFILFLKYLDSYVQTHYRKLARNIPPRESERLFQALVQHGHPQRCRDLFRMPLTFYSSVF